MNKTILITGSTDGIGKLAAIKLAQDGHQIYLHGRNSDKLTRVIAELKTITGNQSIDGFVSDFSSLTQVKIMADNINNKLSKIDILINNAGVFKSTESQTEDGIDVRIVVNYYASYLLTTLLIDKLKASNQSKIINLSSAAQSSVSMGLLDGSLTVSDQEAYAQSKLSLLMWSYHLAKQEPSIAVVALNPGSLLDTNMVREAYGKSWSSADKGADIIYDLAITHLSEDIDGKYFDNDKGDFGLAHPDASDDMKISTLINYTKSQIEKLL